MDNGPSPLLENNLVKSHYSTPLVQSQSVSCFSTFFFSFFRINFLIISNKVHPSLVIFRWTLKGVVELSISHSSFDFFFLCFFRSMIFYSSDIYEIKDEITLFFLEKYRRMVFYFWYVRVNLELKIFFQLVFVLFLEPLVPRWHNKLIFSYNLPSFHSIV